MNPDLRNEFEAAFDREPPLRPPAAAVAAGRGALRRRRIVTGAVAALGVSALALGFTVLDDDPSRQESPIGRPEAETPAQREQRLTETTLIDRTWREACGRPSQPECDAYLADAAPVGIRTDGGLVRINDRVIIVNRAVDRFPPPGGRRIEVEVRTPESVHPSWWVLTRDADGKVTAEVADPSSSNLAFDTWARAINSDRDVAGAPPTTRARVVIGG